MNSKTVKLGGTYRHYKGNLYKVHQIVRHSESLEELVFYETLYQNPEGKWWVRPLKMFQETIEINGQQQSRFELISDR